MKVSVIIDDNLVCVDGDCVKCTLPDYPEGLKAIQFNENTGEAEWTNSENTSVDLVFIQPFIDAHISAVNAYNTEQDTIKAEWAQRKSQYDYQRKINYPPVEDYLDAIVKGDEAQKQAYIDACLAVKAQYPKPE